MNCSIWSELGRILSMGDFARVHTADPQISPMEAYLIFIFLHGRLFEGEGFKKFSGSWSYSS